MGLILGIIAQGLLAVGFILIDNAPLRSPITKGLLVVAISGVAAATIIGVRALARQETVPPMSTASWLYIAGGSIIALVIAQLLWLYAIDHSSVSTASYAVLAFPAVAVGVDLVRGRAELNATTVIGAAILIAGYLILVQGLASGNKTAG